MNEPDSSDAAPDSRPPTTTPSSDGSNDSDGRIVSVPIRVYKAVTVLSTLFAILGVVFGFVLLDRATDRARADVAEIDPIIALLGLLMIVAAAVVYSFSTRFHAEEMGKPKEKTDEHSDNG